jgi:ParB family transcriptional regulator, chromosome partitioning protein
MDGISLRLMKDRRYEMVPVELIVVLNSRDREQDKFADNVRSIQDVGLLKPVLLNERFFKSSGKYELVCGEGRLIAHQRLQKAEIAAEIIDCDRKQAYLISLIENIARVPPGTMWFATEVKRMKDAGMTLGEIAKIVGRSENHVASCITLLEKGEERLLRGVDQGVFPMTFAMEVAESNEAQTQNLLMDAFDTGLVSTSNLRRVRQIIKERLVRLGIDRKSDAPEADSKAATYTVVDLKRDIAKISRDKESFVREATTKERRLVTLTEGLKELRSTKEFLDLLKSEGLDEVPELQGLHKV